MQLPAQGKRIRVRHWVALPRLEPFSFHPRRVFSDWVTGSMVLRGRDRLPKGLNARPRYARLSGEAIHPSGARPSKCIIIL
jgi:hypothetical protein